MDTLKILGKNIKFHRTQLGLTQEDVANLSGVYRSHLAGIETGSVNPSVKTVEKIARALNISVASLFNEETD